MIGTTTIVWGLYCIKQSKAARPPTLHNSAYQGSRSLQREVHAELPEARSRPCARLVRCRRRWGAPRWLRPDGLAQRGIEARRVPRELHQVESFPVNTTKIAIAAGFLLIIFVAQSRSFSVIRENR